MKPKKQKQTVFLSGKVTGLPRWMVWLKFEWYAMCLRLRGYKVWNPVARVNKNASWGEAIKKCIEVIPTCQFIYFQPDWRNSKGACCEFYIAVENGLEILNTNPSFREQYMKEVSRRGFNNKKQAV